MNNVSRLKIMAGYALLLALLAFALLFLRREMENLTLSEDRDTQWTDSLIGLLHEKDSLTISMLRELGKIRSDLLSPSDIRRLTDIVQDTALAARKVVQHRVVRHRDTVVTHTEKKGFFRRLGEVFAPPKADTAIQVKTSTEFNVDTVVEVYNPMDSIRQHLQAVAQRRKEDSIALQRRNRRLRKLDRQISARIDSLVKGYERHTLERTRQEAAIRQETRRRSAHTIGGIAAGAVVLAAVFLLVIGRDVARSNRYRRQLEEARRRAEALLATREKLMLAITHDFKAPLGSIMGYADLLSRLTVDERQRFYLDNMKNSSRHLLKLVVDLLDFHRLDQHKVEARRVPFHPARLLEDVCVSFRPMTQAKGIDLCTDISPELGGSFECDPLRLRQIAGNLLSNAVKFTTKGSVTLSARYAAPNLIMSVADTGQGMRPADCERIFQAFTRLPGAQGEEGFGLGLSIVHMLVQLLGGHIDVQSYPGKGSTFTVTLPVQPVADTPEDNGTDDAPPPPSATLPTATAMPRVLLIDDDRIQLTLTSAMLAQRGIHSVCCLQTDELLNALRNETFDVLLTDVQMPAINGFDLLRLLRASNIAQARTIPMIAVTARSDMRREDFTSCGFAGCLYKPFTVAELLRELGLTPDAAPQQPQPATPQEPDFSALTSFSGDDPEASRAILQSFMDETRRNQDSLRQAQLQADTNAAASVAHKMLPLCKLIGASALAARLAAMERQRDMPFGTVIDQDIADVLLLTDDVLKRCAAALDAMR